MLSILLLAMVQSPPPALMPIPRYASLEGPREVCTEFFDVRLEAGEILAWTNNPVFTGGISHVLMAEGRTMQIGPWQGEDPPSGGVPFEHPSSPISERAWRNDQARKANGEIGPAYRISYYLHGGRRMATPLSLSFLTSDPSRDVGIVQRITPGTLEERNCPMPTRLDPAVAGEIGSVYPFR